MTVALIMLALFALFVCAAAALDIVPAVRNWAGRIGIGSLSPEQAEKKMQATAEKWLLKTPSVPVSDQTRFTLPERIQGTYKSKNIQAWQQGALLLGVLQSGDTESVEAFLKNTLADGQWKRSIESADFALLAYAVLLASPDKAAIRPAMDEMYRFLQTDGTVPYNRSLADIRFVDTVGMVCPFLWLYAETYDCPDAKALCMRQIREYAAYGVHDKLCLPVHCFRTANGAPLGIYGWGRGCGWYALALSELLSMDADVLELAVPFADALLLYQQENGAWSRQLLYEGGGESSATAMLGFFMAVLYSRTQSENYKRSAEKAKAFLRSATRRSGAVDYAQGDTKGIGFYSAKLSVMPAAQGFALRLTEVTV